MISFSWRTILSATLCRGVFHFDNREKFVQVDFVNPRRAPPRTYEFELPWNHIPSVPSNIKDLETVLRELGDKVPALLDEVGDLVQGVEKIVVDSDVAGLVE